MADSTLVVGEVTDFSAAGKKRPRIVDAFQAALENAPPFPPHTDVQSFKLVSLEVEFGGITGSTMTRVTVECSPHPLPRP